MLNNHAPVMSASAATYGDLEYVRQSLSQDMAQRVATAHEALNERLQLKDRWIESRFKDLEKSDTFMQAHLEARIDQVRDEVTRVFHERDKAATERAMAIAEAVKAVEAMVQASVNQHATTHRDQHETYEKAQDEFKKAVQHSLTELKRDNEKLKEERVLLVTRDQMDAQVGAVSKIVDSIERQFREQLEIGMKQLDTKLDSAGDQLAAKFETRISANTDRIARIESGISVMNARNQQSIIALGVLLTLVEIMIRFIK